VELWNGYRLLGTDGSTVELPNSKDIQESLVCLNTVRMARLSAWGRT
jgi:hypothetical protein